MGDIGECAMKGRDRIKSGVNVLNGSVTCGARIWLRVLGDVNLNVKNCGRDTPWVSETNQG